MLKNILSKILGLDRKEKRDPVEQTPRTQLRSTDPPPQPLTPARDGLNLQNAAVSIPSPGGEGWCPSGRTEGGLSAPASDFRRPVANLASAASVSKDSALRTPNSALTDDAPAINPKSPPPLTPLPPVKFPVPSDFRNPATNREPRGKVAHLPPAVRHQVCEWISEGLILEEIVKRLADLGHPGFTHQNISKWKDNGYRTWCQHQEKLQRIRLRAEDSISLITDCTLSDGMLAAAEIDAATALEDAYLAFNLAADDDARLKHVRIIDHHARTFARLNQQRQRSRKINLDHEFRLQKLASLIEQHSHFKDNSQSAKELREQIFDLVDETFGIKSNRNGARVSLPVRPLADSSPSAGPASAHPQIFPSSDPASAPSAKTQPILSGAQSSESGNPNQTARTNEKPKSAGIGCGTVELPSDRHAAPLTELPRPTDCKDHEASVVTSAHFCAPPASEAPLSQGPLSPFCPPVSSCEATQPILERVNPKKDITLAKYPSSKNKSQICQESAAAIASPYPPGAKPLTELPVPTLGSPYPPAPLTQPANTLALCNHNGLITAWVPISGNPAKTKPWIQPIKDLHTGKTICWFDYHSRPPGTTDSGPVRGQPHFIPVFDDSGRIISWAPEPNGRHKRPPTLTAIALESDHPRTHFAWLDYAA